MSVLTMLFQDFAARLCSTEFLQDARHADHPTAFSRCRKLPLPTLVAIMLTGMRLSMQAELDTFFAHLRQQAQLVREVSEQAFPQPRFQASTTGSSRAPKRTGLCRAGADCVWSPPTLRRCVSVCGPAMLSAPRWPIKSCSACSCRGRT